MRDSLNQSESIYMVEPLSDSELIILNPRLSEQRGAKPLISIDQWAKHIPPVRPEMTFSNHKKAEILMTKDSVTVEKIQ